MRGVSAVKLAAIWPLPGLSRTFDDPGSSAGATIAIFQEVLGRSGSVKGRHHRECVRDDFFEAIWHPACNGITWPGLPRSAAAFHVVDQSDIFCHIPGKMSRTHPELFE